MLEGFSSTGSTLQRPPTILRSYLPNQMCWAVRNPSTGPSSTRWFRTLPLAWARWNLMRCGDEWSLAISLSLIHCSTDIWYLVISLLFPNVSNLILVHCVHRCIEYNLIWIQCIVSRWMAGNIWACPLAPPTWACSQVMASARSFVPPFGAMDDKGRIGSIGGIGQVE